MSPPSHPRGPPPHGGGYGAALGGRNLGFLFHLAGLVFFSGLIGPVHGDSAVVFNEIMFHPMTNESELEWVELENQFSVDVDISRWSLDNAIRFTFPPGTIIKSGGFLVIASSPAALASATGLTNILGPFSNRLSNAGEKLQLRDNNNRIMDELVYGVEGDWPVAPDGAGPSLARRSANLRGSR